MAEKRMSNLRAKLQTTAEENVFLQSYVQLLEKEVLKYRIQEKGGSGLDGPEKVAYNTGSEGRRERRRPTKKNERKPPPDNLTLSAREDAAENLLSEQNIFIEDLDCALHLHAASDNKDLRRAFRVCLAKRLLLTCAEKDEKKELIDRFRLKLEKSVANVAHTEKQGQELLSAFLKAASDRLGMTKFSR